MSTPLYIAAGANMIGGIIGARGMKGAADATAAIADYNARLEERNAKALRQAAEVREWQGDVAEVDLMEDFGDFVDTQQAFYGAAGTQAGTGTPLEVAFAAAEEVSDDLTMMNYNVAVESNAIRDEAINRQFGAAVTRAEGRVRASAMRTQARSKLFSTAGSSLMMAFA